jgi:DNA mismatch repair protein MutS
VLETKENNFVACVHFSKQSVGAAFLDISTGEFLAAEGNSDYIDKLLNNFAPKEVLFERNHRNDFESSFGQKFFTYTLDDWMFTAEAANDRLTKQFETKNLKGFGVDKIPNGVIAAGAILHYLDMTQHLQTGHISCLSRIEEDRYVWLDKFTVRNLELYGTYNEGAKTLVDIIDQTISPMGGRMLRRWVAFPLKHIKPIQDRQSVVKSLIENAEHAYTLSQALGQIGDLERLISKVAVGRINPREMVQLHYALEAIKPIKEMCEQVGNTHLKHIAEQLNPCPLISARIAKEINDNPPAMLNKNGIIRDGVDAELDDLRMLSTSSKDYL